MASLSTTPTPCLLSRYLDAHLQVTFTLSMGFELGTPPTPRPTEDPSITTTEGKYACPEMDVDFGGNDITVIMDVLNWEECGKELRPDLESEIHFQLPPALRCQIASFGPLTTETPSTGVSQKPATLDIATWKVTLVVKGDVLKNRNHKKMEDDIVCDGSIKSGFFLVLI